MTARVLRPRQAIRATCLECCAGSRKAVSSCAQTECPLWEHRFGKRPKPGTARRTPLQAIKAYYRWLQGGSRVEVRDYPIGLPIDPWRMGKRPTRAVHNTPEIQRTWFPWLREEHGTDGSIDTGELAADFTDRSVPATRDPSGNGSPAEPARSSIVFRKEPGCRGGRVQRSPAAIRQPDLSANWRQIDGDMPGVPRDQQRAMNHVVLGETTSRYKGDTLLETLCVHTFPRWRVKDTPDDTCEWCSTCEQAFRGQRARDAVVTSTDASTPNQDA